MLNHWYNEDTLRHALSSLALILSIFFFRYLTINAVRRWKVKDLEIKRRWIVSVKNICFVLIVLGLLIIWASELRNFALSLVAIAAAVVISIKELIMCFLGGTYKMSVRPFDIGDRIEVKGIKGDVVEHNLLSTTVYEIGPGREVHQYTGKSITFPNSVLLSEPLIREAKNRFVLHTFTVPVKISSNWRAVERGLCEAAMAECRPFLEDARRYFASFEEREGIEAPSVEPKLTLQFIEPEVLNFVLRVPAPGLRKGRVEQGILRRFMEKDILSPEPSTV